MPMERLACFGKREKARRAVDEAHAELGLQRSNAAAKLRRLQAVCSRRRRVGAEVDDFGENIEVVEVLNWVIRGSRLFYSGQMCVLYFDLAQGSLQK